ncbi:hypothetical protein ACOME3_010288 [Neoechinorhynchus agilis]
MLALDKCHSGEQVSGIPYRFDCEMTKRQRAETNESAQFDFRSHDSYGVRVHMSCKNPPDAQTEFELVCAWRKLDGGGGANPGCTAMDDEIFRAEISAAFDGGDYYTAHQLYKSAFFRLLRKGLRDVCRGVMRDGIDRLRTVGEWNSCLDVCKCQQFSQSEYLLRDLSSL